jgi:hypothetical protein
MTTLEYVEHRRTQKCKKQKQHPVKLGEHQRLGELLSKKQRERDQMEVDNQPRLQCPSPDLDFIF